MVPISSGKNIIPSLLQGYLSHAFMVSSAVVLPFIISPHSDKVITGGISYVQVQMDNLEPPIDEIVVPPPPPPSEAARMQEIVKYVPPVVVDTVLPLETTQQTADEVLAQPTTEIVVAGGTGTGDDLLSGQEGIETDEAFFIVEVMPSFKGGDINKFREWVMKRTNYPQAAVDNRIEGKVYLTFIVETDGTVSNVTVVRELIRSLIKKLSGLYSHRQNGAPAFREDNRCVSDTLCHLVLHSEKFYHAASKNLHISFLQVLIIFIGIY